MQRAQAAQPDPSSGVAAPSRPTTPWRVVSVLPERDFRLRVVFADQTTGEVDLRTFLDSGKVDGTIFQPLRDPAFFRQVRAEEGAVTWPNGADLAPDAMYDAIVERGVWLMD